MDPRPANCTIFVRPARPTHRSGADDPARFARSGVPLAFLTRFHHNFHRAKSMVRTVQRSRTALRLFTASLAALALGTPALKAVHAGVKLPPISVGAGVRTSFSHTETNGAAKAANDFNLDSIRLYLSGPVTKDIKLMFNTEYKGSPPQGNNSVQVLDAVAEFAFSKKLNIWAGRFLPPSDRANLYGPYYANQWNVYDDGVQDGYPSTAVGRDNGVAYWGQFGMLKVSAGAFEVPSTYGTSNVVYAGRLQLDLWDPEPGYYLNGTYYGKKNLLAFGVAGQSMSNRDAYSADFLLEKNFPALGVFTVESEYAKYDRFGGYAPSAKESNGYYVLASYVYPKAIGMGKPQLLVKYAHATYEFPTGVLTDGQKTTDVELNYIISSFNARVSLYYLDINYANQIAGRNHKVFGLGVQLQM